MGKSTKKRGKNSNHLRWIVPEKKRLHHFPANELSGIREENSGFRLEFRFTSTQNAARFAWVQLTKILKMLRGEDVDRIVNHAKWRKISRELHDALSQIPGNVNREEIMEDGESYQDDYHPLEIARHVQCDACYFTLALMLLVEYDLIDGTEDIFTVRNGSQEEKTFDFKYYFSLALEGNNDGIHPKSSFILRATTIMRDAFERIDWLKSARGSITKKANAEKGSRRGRKPEYNNEEKQKILDAWKLAKADGKKLVSFYSQYAKSTEKPVEEVKKLYQAARKWEYRSRLKVAQNP